MTIPLGYGSENSKEVFLDRSEIEVFRDTEVWPAINYLAGFDFVDEAAIGTELHHSLLLPRLYGTEIVQVNSIIWAPDEGGYSNLKTRYCSTEIRIDVCQGVDENITQKTLFAAGESDAEEDRFVWEVKTYTLSTDPEDLIGNEKIIEVRSQDNEVIWDDTDMIGVAPYSEDVTISNDSEQLLYALGLRMLQCFTNYDRRVLCKALTDLGVPTNVVKVHDPKSDLAVEPPNN